MRRKVPCKLGFFINSTTQSTSKEEQAVCHMPEEYAICVHFLDLFYTKIEIKRNVKKGKNVKRCTRNLLHRSNIWDSTADLMTTFFKSYKGTKMSSSQIEK